MSGRFYVYYTCVVIIFEKKTPWLLCSIFKHAHYNKDGRDNKEIKKIKKGANLIYARWKLKTFLYVKHIGKNLKYSEIQIVE